MNDGYKQEPTPTAICFLFKLQLKWLEFQFLI